VSSISEAKPVLDIIEKFINRLDALKSLEIKGKELTLRVPERAIEIGISIDIHRHRLIGRTVEFPFPEIIRARAVALPTLIPQSQAIELSERGLSISFSKLSNDVERLLLSVQYKLPAKLFIEDIVQTNVQTEPRAEVNEYWMHAQLRYLRDLIDVFQRFEVYDVPFLVNVAVHQEVKTSIPSNLLTSLRITREWMETHDRERKAQLSREHLRLGLGDRKVGKEHEILSSIQELFLPTRFRNFIEVEDPFRYSESIQGSSRMAIPNYIIPEVMKVVSRTDLSLEKPAAKGKLVYMKRKLSEEIHKAFRV